MAAASATVGAPMRVSTFVDRSTFETDARRLRPRVKPLAGAGAAGARGLIGGLAVSDPLDRCWLLELRGLALRTSHSEREAGEAGDRAPRALCGTHTIHTCTTWGHTIREFDIHGLSVLHARAARLQGRRSWLRAALRAAAAALVGKGLGRAERPTAEGVDDVVQLVQLVGEAVHLLLERARLGRLLLGAEDVPARVRRLLCHLAVVRLDEVCKVGLVHFILADALLVCEREGALEGEPHTHVLEVGKRLWERFGHREEIEPADVRGRDVREAVGGLEVLEARVAVLNDAILAQHVAHAEQLDAARNKSLADD
eukprot:1856539-Prymnesium_polylepis.1